MPPSSPPAPRGASGRRLWPCLTRCWPGACAQTSSPAPHSSLVRVRLPLCPAGWPAYEWHVILHCFAPGLLVPHLLRLAPTVLVCPPPPPPPSLPLVPCLQLWAPTASGSGLRRWSSGCSAQTSSQTSAPTPPSSLVGSCCWLGEGPAWSVVWGRLLSMVPLQRLPVASSPLRQTAL